MKFLLLILLLSTFAFTVSTDCGTYRWDYKILIDSAGLELFDNTPVRSSIKVLTQITRPNNSAWHNKRADEENRVVRVTAYVIAFGKEDNDRDYHLILKSTTCDSTLIAEIPDPTCSKIQGFPGLIAKYTLARTFAENNIDATPTGDIKPLATPLKVRIVGVPFFDKTAHGNGHAFNGIEIHPILEIQKAR